MSGSTVLREVNHAMRVAGIRPEHVWSVYTNVSHWKLWKKSLEYTTLEGPFATGSTIKMKLKGPAPELAMELSEVVENVVFSDTTPAPFGTVLGSHRITDLGDEGCEIYHEIKVQIPEEKAAFFDENIFPRWNEEMPKNVNGVAELAKQVANGATPFAEAATAEVTEETAATPA